MNDTQTETEQQPELPDWLVKAEEEAAARQKAARQAERAAAQRHADLVNEHLKELGIEPIEPARVDDAEFFTVLRPAFLAPGDYQADEHPVWASYDTNRGVTVNVGPTDRPYATEYAANLTSVKDVVDARHAGPAAQPPRPVQELDWRAEAIRRVRPMRSGRTDGDAVSQALDGMTAVMLSLAPNGRPPVPTGTEVDLDCEFLPGDLSPSGLVSLALNAGPGRTLYLVNADMDTLAVRSKQFMRAEVWPCLPLTLDGELDRSHPDVQSYDEIRRRVEKFFAGLGNDVTLWVYCGAQDVIRLHTLWGNDWQVMPGSVPQWADDLARLRREAGGVKLPPHTGRRHHALEDTEHQRQARAYLRGLIG
ncbi:hypothetical protein KUF83_30175 [Streptomyces sp. BV286]|uniref:hypothetical protein n=1 Tax=Streptomyces sp. BV286 TaxID=2849672 RepID=UPI001C2E635E|nr:hypothetical protein [Streptomyces sp. BV286]MBV1940804.1 hypothetical protein [Streptomyces sp. BV286]